MISFQRAFEDKMGTRANGVAVQKVKCSVKSCPRKKELKLTYQQDSNKKNAEIYAVYRVLL